MMRKWTANNVILLTSIGLLILLGIVAVVSYSQYGKGLGYYLVLVLPFIAIVIGLLVSIYDKSSVRHLFFNPINFLCYIEYCSWREQQKSLRAVKKRTSRRE